MARTVRPVTSRTLGALLALMAAVPVSACSGLGDETAKATSCEDLSDVCPVGALPVAEKSVVAKCGADLKYKPREEEIEVSGLCVGDGDCRVVCLVTKSQCECGVESLTRDEVKCRECPRCGNGFLEATEACDLGDRNGTVGSGCSGTCSLTGCPDQERRCSGSYVQKCTNNKWTDELDCGAEGGACQLGACVEPESASGCDECGPASCVNGVCYTSTCCTSAGKCSLFAGQGPAPVGSACTCLDFNTYLTTNGLLCVSDETPQ
jgi:hypothetical protein